MKLTWKDKLFLLPFAILGFTPWIVIIFALTGVISSDSASKIMEGYPL